MLKLKHTSSSIALGHFILIIIMLTDKIRERNKRSERESHNFQQLSSRERKYTQSPGPVCNSTSVFGVCVCVSLPLPLHYYLVGHYRYYCIFCVEE